MGMCMYTVADVVSFCLIKFHFSDASILKVFYNSAYSFSGRLYASLDVDLPHIRLYQPLTELTQQSLIYVKDTLSQKIFR